MKLNSTNAIQTTVMILMRIEKAHVKLQHLAPTLQKFPYLLTENFASNDCTGPGKDVYVEVTGVCNIHFSYTLAPTAENPNNYEKTQQPGSFKISAEGVNRYKESFSDDKCLTPTAPKRTEGTLGFCMPVTSSDPSNPTRSTKYSGITNLNDLLEKYPGYLVYSDYLGNDCTGGLTSLFLQDPSKTCYPNPSTPDASYSKSTCDAASLYTEAYSDATCTTQVAIYPYPPTCRNKSPEEISSVAKSSKTTCSVVSDNDTKSPTPLGTRAPTPLGTPVGTKPPNAVGTKAPTPLGTPVGTKPPNAVGTKVPTPLSTPVGTSHRMLSPLGTRAPMKQVILLFEYLTLQSRHLIG